LSSTAASGATVEVTLVGSVTDEAGNEAPRPTTRMSTAGGGPPV
jgi:hypothetical protein